MRSIIYLFIITLTIGLLSGCSRSNDPALVKAERLMDTDHKQVLHILDSIPDKSLSNENDRALYALLITQAQIKNHQYPKNDSLIKSAVEYFKPTKDPDRALRAVYYKGVTNFNCANYPAALTDFLKAKDMADEQEEYFWAGMACRGISNVYAASLMRGDAAEFAGESLKYMRKAGTQPYLDYALLNYAVALCNNRATAESLKLCQELKDSAQKHDNPHLQAHTLSTEAVNLIW